MMKRLKPDVSALPAGSSADASLVQQRRSARLARKEVNNNIEDLKLRLFHIAEAHMDQVVRLIKRWLKEQE